MEVHQDVGDLGHDREHGGHVVPSRGELGVERPPRDELLDEVERGALPFAEEEVVLVARHRRMIELAEHPRLPVEELHRLCALERAERDLLHREGCVVGEALSAIGDPVRAAAEHGVEAIALGEERGPLALRALARDALSR